MRRATTIRTVLTGPLRALTVAVAVLVLIAVAPASAPATPAPAPATTASAPATPTRTVVIGHSVKGRPIIAIVRGPNDAPRKILVNAVAPGTIRTAIHAGAGDPGRRLV